MAAIRNELLSNLPDDDRLNDLSLLPTCGTKFYRRNGTWQGLYSENFDPGEKAKIIRALDQALELSGFKAGRSWGDLIEDRDSQITLSALGQQAPLDEKKKWDPDFKKREKIKTISAPLISEFSIHLGGATSIDVTRPGIDKAYGIEKASTRRWHRHRRHDFCGRRALPWRQRLSGEASRRRVHRSADPQETKRVIETIIACLEERENASAGTSKLKRIGTIMEPRAGDPNEVEGVLNPAAVRARDGQLYLFPRLVARGNYSRIGIARVLFDSAGDPIGVERMGIALEPEADYELSETAAGAKTRASSMSSRCNTM